MHFLFTLAVLFFLTTTATLAGQHWSGPPFNFSNTGAQNTDVIIAGAVEIKRGVLKGIYNAAQESSYNSTTLESPRGTLWAASGLVGNPTFAFGAAAQQGVGLNFNNWGAAYGGSQLLATQILNRPTVVKIPGSTAAEDIYLDLIFTQWGSAGSGGLFAYTRSTPPPVPVAQRVPLWPMPAALISFLVVAGIAIYALRRRTGSRANS